MRIAWFSKCCSLSCQTPSVRVSCCEQLTRTEDYEQIEDYESYTLNSSVCRMFTPTPWVQRTRISDHQRVTLKALSHLLICLLWWQWLARRQRSPALVIHVIPCPKTSTMKWHGCTRTRGWLGTTSPQWSPSCPLRFSFQQVYRQSQCHSKFHLQQKKTNTPEASDGSSPDL